MYISFVSKLALNWKIYSHGFPCFPGTGKKIWDKKEPVDTTGATTPALHADEP
jgi:hypothetical protein